MDRERQRDRRRADDDRNESRFTSRGFPSRSRDVAIFEYAPGRSIVVDGVVRESAGVTLNWKRPASIDGLREIQSLRVRSEEHTSELQSLMRISYAVFCLKQKKQLHSPCCLCISHRHPCPHFSPYPLLVIY